MDTDVWNERVARGYDASTQHMYAPEVLAPAVDFLHRRAGSGGALEFAVGTGRVALALSARRGRHRHREVGAHGGGTREEAPRA